MTLSVLLLGFLLGLEHAVEADHAAAVATLGALGAATIALGAWIALPTLAAP